MKWTVTATNIININLLAKFVIVEKCFIVRAFYKDGILVFVKYWKIFPRNISWSNPLHGWGAKKFCVVFSKIPPPLPPATKFESKIVFHPFASPYWDFKIWFPSYSSPPIPRPSPKKNQFIYNWFAENWPLTR